MAGIITVTRVVKVVTLVFMWSFTITAIQLGPKFDPTGMTILFMALLSSAVSVRIIKRF